MAPIDTKLWVVGTRAALVVPRAHRVGFRCTVAQEVVVRNGVVNPTCAVQRPRAAAPFFRRHVGVAAAVGTVPTLVVARTAEPTADFVILRPRDAFGVGNRRRIGHIDDAKTCIPIGDVEQGLAGDGVDVEDVVVVKQRAAAGGLRFR